MSFSLQEKLIAAGVVVAGFAAVLVMSRGVKQVGRDIGGAAVDLADGIISEGVMSAGELIGVPRTNADTARRLMDEYASAAWYEQAVMAFQIMSYASAPDYLKWTVDKSHRPALGAY